MFQIAIKLLENMKSIFKTHNTPDGFNGVGKIFQQVIGSTFIHPKQNNILKINGKNIKELVSYWNTGFVNNGLFLPVKT